MRGLTRSSHANQMRRADDGPRVEYLAFLLAGELYAAPIVYVHEILKPPPITGVPRAASDVRGVTSVRGRLHTVIDLRRRLGLAPGPISNRSRILLVKGSPDDPMGLLVDEVVQVYRLAEAEVEPAQVLGGDHPAHIGGIGRPPGALLVLLDLRPILERT